MSDLQKQYDEQNNKAIDYITNHLSPSALQKVKDVGESASRMWGTLKESYENKSVSNQLNLLTRLINLRMTEGSTLDQHYSKLDGIVSELRLAGAKTAEDEPLLTAVLLASMPATFNAAVTAISMGSSVTPSYEDVRKRLRDHALAITLKTPSEATHSGTSTSATVMVATEKPEKTKNKKNPNQRKKNAVKTNDQQYGFGFRGANVRGRGRGRGPTRNYRGFGRPQPYPQLNAGNFWVANNQCSYCKQYGHQHTACTQLAAFKTTRGRGQAQANLISVAPPIYDEFGFIGMLTYNSYLSINTNTNNTSVHKFYVDSGSNRFIVTNLNLLTNIRKLTHPSEIHLFKKEVVIHATHVLSLIHI